MSETLDDKMLMLETVNELSSVLGNSKQFLSVAGHNINTIADYHNPYDAMNLDYSFTTIEEEITQAELTIGTRFTSFTGKLFTIKNFLPDGMGWVKVSATWDGPNVYS